MFEASHKLLKYLGLKALSILPFFLHLLVLVNFPWKNLAYDIDFHDQEVDWTYQILYYKP
jgi:hypothetical protein